MMIDPSEYCSLMQWWSSFLLLWYFMETDPCSSAGFRSLRFFKSNEKVLSNSRLLLVHFMRLIVSLWWKFYCFIVILKPFSLFFMSSYFNISYLHFFFFHQTVGLLHRRDLHFHQCNTRFLLHFSPSHF